MDQLTRAYPCLLGWAPPDFTKFFYSANYARWHFEGSGEAMKVVQLGCGTCGLVCAEHLAKNPKVSHLTLADMNTDGAQALAERIKSDKVSVQKVDGTKREELEKLLSGQDIVIATMPWRLNKLAMEVATKTKTHYIDFGMPFDSTGQEFDRFAEMCRDAGISALIGMGVEPGISDVFAMRAASKLDRADEAHVYDGDTAHIEGIEIFSPWSPIDMLDETSVHAAVFRDGKIEFVPPLSMRQTYDFPEPVGRLTVYKTNHDETYFMPMEIKTLRNASFNIAIDDNFVEAAEVLQKTGMLSKEPIEVRGVKIRPLDVVAALMPTPANLASQVKGDACVSVEVSGQKEGKRTMVRIWMMLSHEKTSELYGTSATGYLVGTGGAIATEMLIDGEVEKKGFVIPEQLPTDSFISRLGPKGLKFNEEIIPL